MLTAILISNKETPIRDYLVTNSLFEVTAEERSISNLNRMEIIDVDKLIYIFYNTDDIISFKTDMSALRKMLDSSFFNIQSATFIFVDTDDISLENIALAASKAVSDTNVIYHKGNLMLTDVGKYLTGKTYGKDAESSYLQVYITEASSDEKERYENKSDGIDTILPAMTDTSKIYTQRSIADSMYSTIIREKETIRPVVGSFSSYRLSQAKEDKNLLVISGDYYTDFEDSIYSITYSALSIGKRCLIVNMLDSINIPVAGEFEKIFDLSKNFIPTQEISIVDSNMSRLAYILSNLHRVEGIDIIIIITDCEDYKDISSTMKMSEYITHSIFITHFGYKSIDKFIRDKLHLYTDCVFLRNTIFKECDISSLKSIESLSIARFPNSEEEFDEFYNICLEDNN